MGYYRTVEGQKMDAQLLELAEKAVKGVGDGRISVEDAHGLWDAVKDGGIYTDIEKVTVEYIRTHFKWTMAADEWFRRQETNWFSHEHRVHMTPQQLSTQHFAHHDVLDTQAEREKRKHRLEAAVMEAAHDREELGLLVQLADGTAVEVYSNFVEMAGDFVELWGGCLVPLKAIEKVGL